MDEIDNEGAGTEDTIVEEKKEKKKKKDKAGTVITATDDETPQVPKGPKLKTDPKKMTKEEKKRFKLGFDIIDDSSDEAEEEEVKTPIAEIKESKDDLTSPPPPPTVQAESLPHPEEKVKQKKPKLKTDPKKMTKEEKKRFKLGFDVIDYDEEDEEEDMDFEKDAQKMAAANELDADKKALEEIIAHSREEESPEDVSILNDHAPKTKDGLTKEERVRKERPPPKVRFAESSQPGFAMMGLEQVSVVFGDTEVISDATFDVKTGERVGLVGPNGGGKTTLLRVLSGEIEPTSGEIVKSGKNLRTAYLRQEFIEELIPTRGLKDELFSAFVEEQALLKEIEAVEDEIAKTTDDANAMEAALNKLAELQGEATLKGVYALDSKVEKIMDQCGFASSDAELPVKSFSGGWKMRIGLAKILLKEPNVLLLDEPTNHLDLESVIWLEAFLQTLSIPMVIVSHDREFLDKVCNKITDVEDGVCVVYTGNYSQFILLKRERLATWREKYERQVKFVKEEERYIKKARNDPGLAQAARAKEQALEKLRQSDEWISQPPKEKRFRFRFPPAPRCGASVIEVEGLTHGYGEGRYKTLFDDVDIQVDKGERVGFIGPNGSGKSTLMRLISGQEDPKGGTADFGSGNIQYNYFAQSQADTLNLENTVLECVQEDAPSDISLTDIRSLLGQFMFKGDDVYKKIKMLSGGEKGRVALCKMMLTPANLLLLDEPTNHLDITSKEVLEDAIQNYDGSVLVISHDRYFMSQVANTIFSFEDKKVMRYDCDYHDFMNRGEKGSLKEKVEARYVENDRYVIKNAPVIEIEDDAGKKKKKNFGGSGVTGGNLNKGIKNAKRFQK